LSSGDEIGRGSVLTAPWLQAAPHMHDLSAKILTPAAQ
jgi:hypothetical protein